MIDQVAASEPPRWSVVTALMAAMFTVAVGYGVVLPKPIDVPKSPKRACGLRNGGRVSGKSLRDYRRRGSGKDPYRLIPDLGAPRLAAEVVYLTECCHARCS